MGQRWAEMKIEGKEQGGGKWGTKKSQRWAGKRMDWRDREEERDKAEMGREADAESGRREIETDRETESEPQRREGGINREADKGNGKREESTFRYAESKETVAEQQGEYGGRRHIREPSASPPAPGCGPLGTLLRGIPEARRAVAWAISPRSTNQEAFRRCPASPGGPSWNQNENPRFAYFKSSLLTAISRLPLCPTPVSVLLTQ